MTTASTSPASKLRLGLGILALVIALGATAFWISTGAHVGFSKDRIERPQIDPITQIEYVDYEETFIMGLEYLALAYGITIIGLAASYCVGRGRDGRG